jgi:hypothetical protein
VPDVEVGVVPTIGEPGEFIRPSPDGSGITAVGAAIEPEWVFAPAPARFAGFPAEAPGAGA